MRLSIPLFLTVHFLVSCVDGKFSLRAGANADSLIEVTLTAEVEPSNNKGAVSVRATTSSQILSLDNLAFTLKNSSITNLNKTSDTSFSFDVIPKSAGPVSIAVEAGTISGVSNNYNKASNELSWTYVPAEVTLNYSSLIFGEAASNNGSITDTVTVSISNDSWTSDSLTLGQHYEVSSVPSGLSLVVTRTSSSEITLSLAGNAASHSNAADIVNLQFTLKAAAFSSGVLPLSGSSQAFSVDFNNPAAPTVVISYSGTTFLESSDNVGAIRTTKLVTITGDTWVSGAYTSGGRYSVTNIPAGLTFAVAYYNSSTLVLSFSGSASSHVNANDVSNIVLTFNASSFTSGSSTASNNPRTLSIDFSTSFAGPQTMFVSSIPYSGNLGGLAGADAKCQSVAESASLTGAWKAVLSSSTVSAFSRIVITGLINSRSGAAIAVDQSDLWDGNIDDSIEATESNVLLSTVSGEWRRWTGTSDDGGISGNNCSNWSTTAGTGTFGRGDTDTTWTSHGANNCTDIFHLHCINGQ